MDYEVKLRKEAIRRLLNGDSKASISRALGKSRQWVGYWATRYDPDDPDRSLQNRPSAPKNPHRQWPEPLVQMALHSRHLRTAAQQPGYEYALIGAEAIHYELRTLGIIPTPPVRTIHSWIKQAGLVQKTQTQAVADKPSKPYPVPVCRAINAVHQLDLKGPIYLTGQSQKYYLLALRDFYSKAVALAAADSRESENVVDFLVTAWQHLGLPRVLQMDNGMEFRGSNRYPRSFGKVVRLCVNVGTEPLFIPPREPWRNGLIENFNGQAERLLFNHDNFANYAELQAGVRRLENAVNSTHRLSALKGQTPHEFRAGTLMRQLPPDYDWRTHDLKLDKGSIALIRLVRKSGRITLCANDKFDIDPELKGQYVLARINVADKKLLIYHDGQLIKTFDF